MRDKYEKIDIKLKHNFMNTNVNRAACEYSLRSGDKMEGAKGE
jgi:hypothetical protein